MTPDKTPSDAEIATLYADETGFALGDSPAALLDFARAVLAKWGSPVVAGEPYAYAVYFPDQPCEELVHDLDDLTDDLTNREHAITELFTAPQPTQAQAGAVPLTEDQIKEGFANRSRSAGLFIGGVRFAEAAHGIKEGGQHAE